MNARSAVVSVQALGLAPELVWQLMGVDLAVELESAEQRVDNALDRLALPDIGAQLADLRADESLTMSDCLASYERIAQAINVLQEVTFRSLGEGTSGVQHGGPELLTSIARLQAAEAARRASALQQAAYFATTFAVRGTPQAELTNLLRIREEYIDALAGLSSPTDNAALRDAFAAIDTSPELNALNELVEERIDRSLQLGVPDALPPMSFT